jgi:hypothetical protein
MEESMFKSLAIGALAAGLVAAAAFSAPPAIAARFGGIGGGAPHVSAPHISPGVGAMHAPRGAFAHPGAGARVYGWQGGPRHGHFHHRRGYGVIVGNYYDGDYGYYRGCEWLHARAEETGSRYWWRRYEDCVEG